jgi:hypothetical protein
MFVIVLRLFKICETIRVNDADTATIFCGRLEFANVNVVILLVVLNANSVVQCEAGELSQFNFQP